MPFWNAFSKPNIENLKAKGDIDGLVKALGYKQDPAFQKTVAIAIVKIIDSKWAKSDQARQAFPHLIEVLRSSSRDIELAKALEKILYRIDANWAKSDAAQAIIPDLNRILLESGEQPSAKIAAVYLLGQMGGASSITTLLGGIVKNRSLGMAFVGDIETALVRIDLDWAKTEQARLALLDLIRHYAIHTIAMEGSYRRVVAELLKKIEPNWAKTEQARQVLPNLIRLYAIDALDMDVSYRIIMRELLEKIDGHWAKSDAARAMLPELNKMMLENGSGMSFLGEIGDASSITTLLTAIEKKIVTGQYGFKAAREALLKINPDWAKTEQAQQFTPILIKMLTNTPFFDAHSVAELLVEINPSWAKTDAARAIIPDLNKMLLESGDKDKAHLAVYFLGEIGDASSIATILEGIKLNYARGLGLSLCQDALLKINADWAKTEQARQALPDLIKIFVVRHYTEKIGREILAMIDTNWPKSDAAQAIVPDLIGILMEARVTAESSIIEYAVKTLLEIDANWGKSDAARAIVPDLIKSLSSASYSIIEHTGRILSEIDADWAKSADVQAMVPKLTEMLVNKTTKENLYSAVGLLGYIGDASTSRTLLNNVQDLGYAEPENFERNALFEVIGKSLERILRRNLENTERQVLQDLLQLKDIHPTYLETNPIIGAVYYVNFSNIRELAHQELSRRGENA